MLFLTQICQGLMFSMVDKAEVVLYNRSKKNDEEEKRRCTSGISIKQLQVIMNCFPERYVTGMG